MFYIILNPTSKSGRGIRIWRELEPIFTQREIPYRLLYSKHAGHISELVHKIMVKHAEDAQPVKVILLGGDGTLDEALQGVTDFSRIHFGYIPTGSSNDFARDLGLPKPPCEILDMILEHDKTDQIRQLDLGVLTYVNPNSMPTRYFAVSTGIGFDAAVCEESNDSSIKEVLNKLKLGKLTYLGIALKQLIQAKSVSCDFILDGKEAFHLNKFLFIATMIHRYEGGGFKFCPAADATDGILNLCVVGNLPKPVILFALPTAFFGKHYLFPHIHHYEASEIEIRTSTPLWAHTDGEVHTKADAIKITCRKGAIRFLN